jgi:HAMP domain-containing protein
VSTPLRGKSWTDTIRVGGLEVARFYSEPVTANGRVFAILQVGQSLDLVTTTLGISAVVLAILFPLLLLVTALIAYWLAGRAFAPVRRLTRFARAAQATNLAVRAPVPRIHDEIRELALTLNDLVARL